jgi:putative protease
MNLAIVADLPDFFSGFMVDFSDIKTETKFAVEKSQLIHHFKNLLMGKPGSANKLQQLIKPTTHAQYKKGI